jgi:hypothetical protein
MEKQDREKPTSPRCLKCGAQPKFITSMLSPSAGTNVPHVRMPVRREIVDVGKGLRLIMPPLPDLLYRHRAQRS